MLLLHALKGLAYNDSVTSNHVPFIQAIHTRKTKVGGGGGRRICDHKNSQKGVSISCIINICDMPQGCLSTRQMALAYDLILHVCYMKNHMPRWFAKGTKLCSFLKTYMQMKTKGAMPQMQLWGVHKTFCYMIGKSIYACYDCGGPINMPQIYAFSAKLLKSSNHYSNERVMCLERSRGISLSSPQHFLLLSLFQVLIRMSKTKRGLSWN